VRLDTFPSLATGRRAVARGVVGAGCAVVFIDDGAASYQIAGSTKLDVLCTYIAVEGLYVTQVLNVGVSLIRQRISVSSRRIVP
jgi:hypothetical protein